MIINLICSEFNRWHFCSLMLRKRISSTSNVNFQRGECWDKLTFTCTTVANFTIHLPTKVRYCWCMLYWYWLSSLSIIDKGLDWGNAYNWIWSGNKLNRICWKKKKLHSSFPLIYATGLVYHGHCIYHHNKQKDKHFILNQWMLIKEGGKITIFIVFSPENKRTKFGITRRHKKKPSLQVGWFLYLWMNYRCLHYFVLKSTYVYTFLYFLHQNFCPFKIIVYINLYLYPVVEKCCYSCVL